MTESDKSVVITGVSGFVGSNLKNYLKAQGGYALTDSSRKQRKPKKDEPQGNRVYSYRQLIRGETGFNCYIHVAGKVYDSKEKSARNEYFKANYDLSKKLFDRFIEDEKAEKFIFLSTIHVLTESPEEELDEDYEPVPVTPYGESKLKAEHYMAENCPPGKKLYLLRPSMIHGPGNKGNLNLLYGLIQKGIPYPIGAYNNKRSFVSIENLCFIIKEILDNDVEPGLYHVADDEPTHTHDLIELIAGVSGKKARIWKIPGWILSLVAKIGNITPFPLNDLRLGKLTGDFIVSNQKIKKAIDKPLPVSSSEGLLRTLRSFHE